MLDATSQAKDLEANKLKLEALNWFKDLSADFQMVADLAGLNPQYFHRKITQYFNPSIGEQIAQTEEKIKTLSRQNSLWLLIFLRPEPWQKLLQQKVSMAMSAENDSGIKPFQRRIAKSFLATDSEELHLVCALAGVKYEPFLRKYQRLFPKHNLGRAGFIKRCELDKVGQYNFADILNPIETKRERTKRCNNKLQQFCKVEQLELFT
jgi:hypothetical protein